MKPTSTHSPTSPFPHRHTTLYPQLNLSIYSPSCLLGSSPHQSTSNTTSPVAASLTCRSFPSPYLHTQALRWIKLTSKHLTSPLLQQHQPRTPRYPSGSPPAGVAYVNGGAHPQTILFSSPSTPYIIPNILPSVKVTKTTAA